MLNIFSPTLLKNIPLFSSLEYFIGIFDSLNLGNAIPHDRSLLTFV